MKKLLIVDGYNVIHQNPEYKKIKVDSLELARVKLIEDLANYQAYTGDDVIVVFDAAERKTKEERKGKVLGVEVVFTRKGESADSCIEKLAFKNDSNKTVMVATSDYHLQRVVFGKGVYRKTPGELANEIKEVKEEQQQYAEETPRTFLEDRLDEEVLDKLRRLLVLNTEEIAEEDG